MAAEDTMYILKLTFQYCLNGRVKNVACLERCQSRTTSPEDFKGENISEGIREGLKGTAHKPILIPCEEYIPRLEVQVQDGLVVLEREAFQRSNQQQSSDHITY